MGGGRFDSGNGDGAAADLLVNGNDRAFHGFPFPRRDFELQRPAPDRPRFLDDFQHHRPTDGEDLSVRSNRDGSRGTTPGVRAAAAGAG